MKPVNHKAWFLVTPVLVLVALSAVIPLMTVVNYSVQYCRLHRPFRLGR
jgi:glycerol transport system permease protein